MPKAERGSAWLGGRALRPVALLELFAQALHRQIACSLCEAAMVRVGAIMLPATGDFRLQPVYTEKKMLCICGEWPVACVVCELSVMVATWQMHDVCSNLGLFRL